MLSAQNESSRHLRVGLCLEVFREPRFDCKFYLKKYMIVILQFL